MPSKCHMRNGQEMCRRFCFKTGCRSMLVSRRKSIISTHILSHIRLKVMGCKKWFVRLSQVLFTMSILFIPASGGQVGIFKYQGKVFASDFFWFQISDQIMRISKSKGRKHTLLENGREDMRGANMPFPFICMFSIHPELVDLIGKVVLQQYWDARCLGCDSSK